MRLVSILLVSFFCFSFRPSTEKAMTSSSNGFYVFVEDHTDRTIHKYIVDSKDSVNIIFNNLFNTELELGNINTPLTILNNDYNFFVARVFVYENQKGKKKFKHLKYANPYQKKNKRLELKPVIL